MAFIKVDRRLFDHWLWKEKPFSKAMAWVDLIQLATHKDEKFVTHGTLIEGKRGNVYRSQMWLAERWGWSRKKVRTFLRLLEKEGMVTVSGLRMGTVNGTVITIENYGKFQGEGTVKGTVKEQSRNSQGTVKEHIQEPNKEPNKEHLKNNIEPSAKKLTDEELIEEGYS